MTRWRLSSPPTRLPLDERERRVLMLRFEQDLNQYEIGHRLGVSQMQVSRIMRRALRKLLAAIQGTAPGVAPLDRVQHNDG